MVYMHLGLSNVTEKEIFENVSGNTGRIFERNCRTHLMVQDALNRELIASSLFANATREAILTAHAHDIDLILLARRNPALLFGHFYVVSNATAGQVYLLDPMGTEKPVHFPYAELDERMVSKGLPEDDIQTSRTMIAVSAHASNSSTIICPYCKSSVPVFNDLFPCYNLALCPTCDRTFDPHHVSL